MPARTIDAADPLLVFVNARGDQLLNLPTIRAIADVFQGRLSVAIRRGAPDDFFRGLNVRRFLELDLDFSKFLISALTPMTWPGAWARAFTAAVLPQSLACGAN